MNLLFFKLFPLRQLFQNISTKQTVCPLIFYRMIYCVKNSSLLLNLFYFFFYFNKMLGFFYTPYHNMNKQELQQTHTSRVRIMNTVIDIQKLARILNKNVFLHILECYWLNCPKWRRWAKWLKNCFSKFPVDFKLFLFGMTVVRIECFVDYRSDLICYIPCVSGIFGACHVYK